MRRTYNDQNVIFDEDDSTKLIGVNFGYDYCAEHEWGIKATRAAFGIPAEMTKKNAGDKYRAITKVPEGLTLDDNSLIFSKNAWQMKGSGYKSSGLPSEIAREPTDADREPFAAGWSDGDFGLAHGDHKVLETLHGAILAKDVYMFLSGSSSPFGGSGFCIVIKSNFPDEMVEEWRQGDLDHLELQAAFAKTGIQKKLADAGLKYYALRPRWWDKEKTEMKFLLNPQEQQKYNHGWWTLDELDLWIKGEGPIIKEKV